MEGDQARADEHALPSPGPAYLVVLREPPEALRPGDPRYRGLFRTPPWSQERFARGFDDPYVFGGLADEHGLVRSYGDAEQVLERFATVEPRSNLEIIEVRAHAPVSRTRRPSSAPGLLGYDVAEPRSPFWSIVAEYPVDSRLGDLLRRLNENGLFSNPDDARAFLEGYRAHGLPHGHLPLVVWEVRSAAGT